jgi:membrane protease subunit HflK
MRRIIVWCLLFLAVYGATGLYIVRGNEQALVRRFGKAGPALAKGGLHVDLPWPLARIERVNVHELRTISVGIVAAEAFDGAGFLRNAGLDRQAEFLTGDKNILNLQVNIHYLVVDPHKYYFGCQSPEIGLKLLAESLVTEKVAQCSVDYVHPLGLNELRALLTMSIRDAVDREPWGLSVDDVTIAGVLPPVEVKAAFLEVSNARAERDRMISQELARAEKLRAASEAGVRQLLDRAESERLARVEAARGSADRFIRVIEQFHREAIASGQTPAEVRRATMQRLWTAALEDLFPRLARQVLLDPNQPLDLFLVNPPTGRQPATVPPRRGAEEDRR